MNPYDVLILIIPAALAAFKLGLMGLAVMLITRSLFMPRSLPQARMNPVPVSLDARDQLA